MSINDIILSTEISTIELETIRYRNDVDGEITYHTTTIHEENNADASSSSERIQSRVVKLLSHVFNLQILKISTITLANGSDNIAIDTLLFAQASKWQIGVYIVIFLLLVLV
ncbi:unnamed protein product [Rotaria magnacalcarata]|uniref:Uncharacterized protein n=1 Tax=Rotaria magnacalcarata TaxID=392030 RepID=A0A816KUJ3_9BILA|nr:unnamed protein product [Rotaria magnacalcarata]CAF4188743.1 unnamed protein product [Rotaria magnacalcarata]